MGDHSMHDICREAALPHAGRKVEGIKKTEKNEEKKRAGCSCYCIIVTFSHYKYCKIHQLEI